MKRRFRIPLELLSPPLLVVLLVELASLFTRSTGEHFQASEQAGSGFLRGVFYCYVVGVVPSALYTAFMEWRFARGLAPRSGRSILLSSSLGLVAGALPGMAIGLSDGADWMMLFMMFGAPTGLVVGLIVGILIWFLSKPVARTRMT